jgi:hypothetical protein
MTVRSKGTPAPPSKPRPQPQAQGQQARFPQYDAQRGLFDVNPDSVRSYQLETYAARRKQRELEQAQLRSPPTPQLSSIDLLGCVSAAESSATRLAAERALHAFTGVKPLSWERGDAPKPKPSRR